MRFFLYIYNDLIMKVVHGIPLIVSLIRSFYFSWKDLLFFFWFFFLLPSEMLFCLTTYRMDFWPMMLYSNGGSKTHPVGPNTYSYRSYLPASPFSCYRYISKTVKDFSKLFSSNCSSTLKNDLVYFDLSDRKTSYGSYFPLKI